MKINILTSAFDNGFPDEFISVVKPHLHGGKFVFAASYFPGSEKTKRYVTFFLNAFAEKGVTFSDVSIIDYGITVEQAHQAIAEAELVWLSGGDTLKEMEYYREYGLAEALKKYRGVTIGMSAGSINMAGRVVLAKDVNDNIPQLSVYDGLGLVEINVEPHVNQSTPEHWQEILEASQLAPIYCLPDDSFIVEQNGSLNFFGPCTLAADGKLVAACGNDCVACPRHMPKSDEELRKTSELWQKIGYRDGLDAPEKLACTGCGPENQCRYDVAACAREHRVPLCADCPEYPCPRILNCFRATESFAPACKSSGCWEELNAAFFRKKENLDSLRKQ